MQGKHTNNRYKHQGKSIYDFEHVQFKDESIS